MQRTTSRFGVAALTGVLLVCVLSVPAAAQPPAHHGHEGHGGASTPAEDHATSPEESAKLLADKAGSEFNHHLAGFLVALAGAFIFFQSWLAKRWPAVRYAWPACFLAAGLFLLVWSDAELWPFGPRAWSDALANDAEVLQHKTFAVLLLALGTIEVQRARGVLTAAWSAWVFPVLAIGGAILLLFHEHEGGMHGPNHEEVMARIQSQHLSFSLVGSGVGLTKGFSELRTRWQGAFRAAWPLLMILLGILLMLYRE
jgi:putative copper resistance protein D